MRTVVSGGAGFVGSHIVDALIGAGHEVWVLDNFSSGLSSNLNPRAHCPTPLDVTSESDVDYLIKAVRPSVICHQAAQPSLLTSVQHPALDAEINILGTINVIEYARKYGAHVTLASTSAVYDETAEQPYTESSRLHPTRPYGIAKMAAECYLRESGVSYTVLRYGNVYGERQLEVGENQLVPHALNHIFDGSPFVVNGTGEQKRDFVYVGEIARANLLAITKRVTGTFNVAHGVPHSVNEVLGNLKHLTGFKGEFKHGPAKAKEPMSVALDSRQAWQKLEWASLVPLVEGLGRTVGWYYSQRPEKVKA